MGKSLNGKELGVGITQRKDGLYQARFTNRFGKRQTVYGKTIREITKKLRDEQYSDARQLNVASSSMTLDEWYEVWLSTYKNNCRNTSLRTYEDSYNKIKGELGWRRLDKLNHVVIQGAFNNLCSDAARSRCKAVVVGMLNKAVEADLLVKNPASGIVTNLCKEEKEEKRILSDEEVEILLATRKRTTMQNLLVIALGTGMRIGEILGLTWDCVDFEKGLIKVRKTMVELNGHGTTVYEFHQPKTQSGKRDIPMIVQVRDALISQKEWKEKTVQNKTPYPGMEDLVFCNRKNLPLNSIGVRHAISRLCKKINKENPGLFFQPFSPHGLRHTFATKCIAKGMRPKTLQKILGHSSLQMTMDLYCHVEAGTLKEEMTLIGKLV